MVWPPQPIVNKSLSKKQILPKNRLNYIKDNKHYEKTL